jgi:hypothetical protein
LDEKKTVVVALSTIEVEYMEKLMQARKQVWLQILCLGIGLVQQVVRIDCDSQSAIFLDEEPNLSFKDKAY